jgi:hypothetical protein
MSRRKQQVDDYELGYSTACFATCVSMPTVGYMSVSRAINGYKSKPRFDRKLLLIKRG